MYYIIMWKVCTIHTLILKTFLIFQINSPCFSQFQSLQLGVNQNWSFTQVETSARLGVESEPLGEMFVYPNPAGNFVKIVSKCLEDGTIEFVGMTGNMAFKQSFNSTKMEQTVDISSLKQGLYIIKVTNETGFKTKKLVKE